MLMKVFCFIVMKDCKGKEKWAQLVLPESLKSEVLNSLHNWGCWWLSWKGRDVKSTTGNILLAWLYKGCSHK